MAIENENELFKQYAKLNLGISAATRILFRDLVSQNINLQVSQESLDIARADISELVDFMRQQAELEQPQEAT